MSTLNVNNINEVGGVDAIVTSGVLDSGSLPVGSILQVVSNEYDTQTGTTSTSYVTTGLSATITPTSSSSKILVLVNVAGRSTTDTGKAFFTIFRGDTSTGVNLSPAGNGAFGAVSVTNGTAPWGTVAIQTLDSPSTASSVTYTAGMKSDSSGNTIYAQIDNTASSITLLEVAA